MKTAEYFEKLGSGAAVGTGFLLAIIVVEWVGEHIVKLLHWAVCR